MLKYIEPFIPTRLLFWYVCIAATLTSFYFFCFYQHYLFWGTILVVSAALSVVGIIDRTQKKQAIRYNYPVLAHFRFFFEHIRPEIRQYFIESDTEELPFSRAQRSMVYQRAKTANDKRPFGTQINVYEAHYEWMNHSLYPRVIDNYDFRITVGGPDCTQPYSCSVFNISAMSYGALSANAIMSLNEGARLGGFYHDTGEGGISKYHRPQADGHGGGDLVLEIGTGYFGCRNEDGSFSEEKFTESSNLEQVKMIEIKLSQGAKPGQGGLLPGAKVTEAIAKARGVKEGVDCVSPSKHSAFNTPLELMDFIKRLRELSGGKPVGFKLAIGHPWEWFAIVKAMMETGITPDFIVVDGGEGGTGAAPAEFSNHVGAPLREGLMLVHNTLVGVNLRDKIKIAASGKIISAFDMVRAMAMGADWCNSARGYMFAVGCLQAQTCHTGNCPTGVATQDPLRMQALNVVDKSKRVHKFHDSSMKALANLIGASGLSHPEEITAEHVIVRVSATQVKSMATLHNWLKPGALLDDLPDSAVYQAFWEEARTDSFEPTPAMLNLSV